MKQILLALFLALSLAIIARPDHVRAAPQDYTYTYTVTNVYTNHVLSYIVSGLDIAEQYVFTFQLTDVNGNVVSEIDQDILGPGITTGTFGTDFQGFEDAYGPLRVVDNFDQTLGEHFVAPAYLGSWQGDGGVTDAENKQGIGDVPYTELNPDYHHPNTDHGAVLTRVGDWTLLHYRTTTPPTDRFIKLFDLSTHTEVAEFSVDELYAYNREITDTIALSFEGLSFVVLNTDGSTLPFINETQDAAAFSGSYTNPHTLSVPAGVYEYARYTGASALVSFGESVWIVSDASDVDEWSVTAKKTSVVDGGQQCALLREKSAAVWAGYSAQLLEDSNVGILDDTDYSFDTFRQQCFDAGTTSPGTLTWTREALAFVEPTIDVADFSFIMTDTYEISTVGTTQAIDVINDGLANFGLDTTLGNLVAMMIGMLALMLITKNPFVAMIGFLGVGGFFILSGLATPLTKILFAGSALFAVILFVRSLTNKGVDA